MACAALKRIFDTMLLDKLRVVVWLVPSDSILTQTIRNLSTPRKNSNILSYVDARELKKSAKEKSIENLEKTEKAEVVD